MAKSKKNKAGGIGISLDGRNISRGQSVAFDTDLGVEEIREITNDSAVEYVEGIPTVSISIEANQYGKRDNIVALSAAEGLHQKNVIAGGLPSYNINQSHFDGTAVDIVVQVEEDGVLKRSCYMGNCQVTGVSWSWDVSGVGTESYNLETGNKTWYLNTYAEIVVMSGYMTPVGSINSGVRYTSNYATGYFAASDFDSVGNGGNFTPLFVTANGDKVIHPTTGAVVTPIAVGNDVNTVALPSIVANSENVWTQISGGVRLRVVGYKNAANTGLAATHLSTGLTDNSGIGGIRKGMIEIYLVSGHMYRADVPTEDAYRGEFLRLQSCSIDADLSREALDELGNYQSFDRSLTFPIPVTVNFSAIASDLEEWARFSNKANQWPSTVTSISFGDFLRGHGLFIKVYDDDESNVSRVRLMTMTVSGLRITAEGYGVDAGGNATQDFTCSADNFVIS